MIANENQLKTCINIRGSQPVFQKTYFTYVILITSESGYRIKENRDEGSFKYYINLYFSFDKIPIKSKAPTFTKISLLQMSSGLLKGASE